jgi:hypothetical protein
MATKAMKWIMAACMLAAMLTGGMAAAGDLDTAFVYQGRLTDGLEAASGSYDFQFKLYDAAEDGALIGAAMSTDDVDVDGGLFEVELDFGHDLFAGDACYLEIEVRAGNEASAYTPLTPRQAFIPVPSAWEYPYAVYASEVRSSAQAQGASVTAVGIGQTVGEDVAPLVASHTIGTGTNSILH